MLSLCLCLSLRRINDRNLVSWQLVYLARGMSRVWCSWVMGVVMMGGWAVGQEDETIQNAIPFNIPRCCPPLHVMDVMDSSCIFAYSVPFRPSVLVNKSLQVATNVVNETWDGSCQGHSSIYTYLDQGESVLTLQEGEDVVQLFAAPLPQIFHGLFKDFCVGTVYESDTRSFSYVVKLCIEDPEVKLEKQRAACAQATCVRKCCPGTDYLKNLRVCVPSAVEEWTPTFVSSEDLNVTVSPPEDLVIVHGSPICDRKLIYEDHEISLLATGELDIPGSRLPPDEYCVESTTPGGDEGEPMRLTAVACYSEWFTSCSWRDKVLIPVLRSVSVACPH